MDLSALVPLFSFAIASALTIAGLRTPRKTRLLLLGPVWLLSLLSLVSCQNLTWLLGAKSTFAGLAVFNLAYSTKILALEEHDVNPELSTHRCSLVDCYRIWNNPRGLTRHSLFDRASPAGQSVYHFALYRSAKAVMLSAFDALIFQKIVVRSLRNVVAADFSPETELSFLSLRHAPHSSIYQLRVRAIVSVQWIWSAYFFMQFYHSLMAVLFVALLRFDQPEDWPPLFGSIREACSIRGFWGRFWHRVTVPTYGYYSRCFTRRCMGIQPNSRLEKTITPLLIFTMSGVSHSLVGWGLGDVGLSRDILFFEVNFLGAAVETAVSKIELAGELKGMFWSLPAPLRMSTGFTWVFLFFFCVSPVWMYPKIYHSVVGLIP